MLIPTKRERLTELAISNGAIVPSIVVEGCVRACESGRRTVEQVFDAFMRVRPDLFSDHIAQRTSKKAAKKAAKVNRQ